MIAARSGGVDLPFSASAKNGLLFASWTISMPRLAKFCFMISNYVSISAPFTDENDSLTFALTCFV